MYGYPYSLRKELWKQIAQLLGNDINPWLIIGDLNEISNLDEKQSQYEKLQLDMRDLTGLFKI